jgi:HTH-type transcriptional regulator/antitoxin HipB
MMSQLARTPKQLGEVLRRSRTLANLTQSQLAARAGLRQATISQIEGGSGATKIETISAVLSALDLELTIAPRSKSSSKDIEDIF